MKTCNKCQIIKNANCFSKGRKSCKDCRSLAAQTYYLKNSEKIKKTSVDYYKNNKEKVKIWSKSYYLKNKEVIKEKHSQYYLNNKEALFEYRKSYWNLEVNRLRRNKNLKIKRDSSVEHKIICNLRSRLSTAVKRKAGNTITLIGCTLPQLMHHLESQFTDGMSFDNYGKWHIDHILPLSSFDLTKSEEVKKASHFSNLQPLWAVDNLKKKDKVINPCTTDDILNERSQKF